MRQIAQLSALVLLAAVTTAAAPAAPAVPGASLVHAPLAIIEGGTVRTLPKGIRSRGGKVIILRGKPAGTPEKPDAAKEKAARTAKAPVRDRARTCACSASDSAGAVVEARGARPGPRVVVIGPDGQARVRYL
jgi:hypothetical protein